MVTLRMITRMRRLSIASTTWLGNRVRFDALAVLVLGLLGLTAGSSGAQGPVWTDDPLVPGVTPIKTAHFTELRTRINDLLAGCGSPAFAFTDATLKAGETPVRAVHVIELRAALGRAYDVCDGIRPIWSDPSPVQGSTIRARHLTELRDATGVLSARSPSLESYYAYIPLNVVDPSYPPQGSFNASADLDGDGNEDLIILGNDYPDGQSTSYSPQPGRVLLGDGDGGFTVAPSELYPVDTLNTVHPRNVPFGDLNGDGRLDMFVADHGWDADPWPGEQNRLYLSRPGGGWRDATDELPQLSDFSHSAAIGDVRGRGVIDIIVGNGYPGQNGILPYALLNDGHGSFVLERAILPVGPGETMDANSAHVFPGTVLTDLDSDGLPELIVTADAGHPYPHHKNHNSTIFWNRSGAFSETYKTVLPKPAPFVDSHIDLHAASIDVDGDGVQDLIVVGTQGDPFYDGWFVQLLMNRGDGTFIDETSSRLRAAQWFGGSAGEETGAPWARWVEVLDFNGDGVSDFAVAPVSGGQERLPQNHPLIWLNDGSGRFAALKVRDFVPPEDEWRVAGSQLMKTRHGYSFIDAASYAGSGGLIVTGLLATRPYP